MLNTGVFAGKTVFITGASRGIGKAIALKLAKDGANIAIAAKTVDPHPKLEGTIYTAAKEVEAVGGKCLPIQTDIREEESVKKAIEETANKFGGIDILVNNASAIHLTGTEATPMKRYDLMHTINTRGTFMTSKYAIPYLQKSSNAHILNLSPPLVMSPKWFQSHVAYTMAKYGMSMCVLGMSEELREYNIAVNALWPRTAIYTAAMKMLVGGNDADAAAKISRKVDILADAAYCILSKSSKEFTGNFCIDEDILKKHGITDMNQYAMVPGSKLLADFFLPEEYLKGDDISVPPGYEGTAPVFEQQSGTSEGNEAVKVFKAVEEMMSDDLKKEINALLLFTVSGQNFYVDANGSRPFQVSQAEIGKPDVTLVTDDATFLKMAKGEIKPTNAFMSGKLKIKGNLAVAMKAEKIFGKLKAKL
ncbi:hydroxysteroid dehydrogenase-like protein 2 [Dinothrombium tinctorium]|uniref:Hydroxysteroid dehydrogenase-like protein 2 n=1 Tax=Dinothrombium tinctorium TaxID=1965070 RepID=A0A443R9Q5_9ACAR|nr:hydroxysteroid dehydrogenase-like protein 2 [Dinothrombium tinctorium]RWS11983.1 hydroxysteroid dehydrogenase-like protein 2 [Dinothrombium tinctorium]RWS15598.1 hydroxysteroid dehydrogenase-like protein 2 [Dinothrombium tinctorium]